MGVAKREQNLWWLSCFSESENWVRLCPFSYWKTHMHTKLKINKSIVIDVLHRLMIKNNWLSDKSTFYVMSCLSLDLEYFLYRMRYLGLLRSQDLHWSWQPARMWNILTTPNASNQWIIMIGLRPETTSITINNRYHWNHTIVKIREYIIKMIFNFLQWYHWNLNTDLKMVSMLSRLMMAIINYITCL